MPVTYDYGDAITVGFPSLTVNPDVCADEAVFSCTPTTSSFFANLCQVSNTNGPYYTETSFDPETGDLTFQTNDIGTLPPGVYKFAITVEIGGKTETIE